MKKLILFVLFLSFTFGISFYANASEVETESVVDEAIVEIDIDCSELVLSSGGISDVMYSTVDMDFYAITKYNEVKNVIKKGIENREWHPDVSGLDLYFDKDFTSNLQSIYTDVLNDDFRYFYMTAVVSCGYYPSTGKVAYIALYYKDAYVVSIDGNANKVILNESLIQQKTYALESKVNFVLNGIDGRMNTLEKVLFVYDYIIRECDYDYKNYIQGTLPDAAYTIEGVLLDGKAVCQGIATTFSLFMQKLGIESAVVGSSDMNHAWNMVEINGEWYHLDATWDDPVWIRGYTYYGKANQDYADEGFVGHTYFLKSDNEFRKLNHYGWENDSSPKASTSRAFEKACFYDVNESMNYYNGYWYYLRGKYMIKTDIWKNNVTETKTTESGHYMHILDNQIFYNTDEMVHMYWLDTMKPGWIYDVNQSMPGYKIHEFVIKNNLLVLVLYNDGTGDFQRVSFRNASIDVKPTNVSLNKTAATLTLKGQTLELNATVWPVETANQTVVWSSDKPSVATVDANGKVTAVSNGTAQITATTKDGTKSATCTVTVKIDPVDAFVAQLYNVCLNREADEAGLKAWTKQLKNGKETGVSAAYGFIFSKEFLDKNLCNEDYVKQLYKAFLGREADAAGLNAWVSVLESGRSREHVFNGFALSGEFAGLCDTYGIVQGKGVDEYTRGTVPTGKCTVCGKKDPVVYEEGVVSFVRRMYLVCLGRDADPSGLEGWSAELRAKRETGRGVAYGFIFSEEFIKKNHSNEDFVEYLYKAFMGRGSDPTGKAAWVGQLNRGVSRLEVFEGFVGSDEFTKICNEYGILRD